MMGRILRSRETVLAVIFLALLIGFSLFVPGVGDPQNLLRQVQYLVAPGIIAVAMTFIIATGGIDLSVGSIAALSGITLGMLFNDAGWPVWLAAAAALAVATTAGMVNGGVSSYLGVPPLVVTLATMALFRGVAMGLSQAKALGGYPPSFQWLGNGDLLGFLSPGGGVMIFPVGAGLLLAVAVAGAMLLRRSWIGRFTEHIGENETAAAFAAIDTRRLKLGLYAASGAVAGLAGLFHASFYGSAKADMATGLELEAIACVVVGGTRISGGNATVWGTLLGLGIIGILRYGLDMADFKATHVVIMVGLLLIGTAVFNEQVGGKSR